MKTNPYSSVQKKHSRDISFMRGFGYEVETKDMPKLNPMSKIPSGQLFYLDFKYEGIKESEGERIFSELDPYGEENWNE